MKYIVSAVLILVMFTSPVRAQAQRAADLTEARELLTAGDADAVAVFLHGSDWCPAGETLKADLWDTDDFAESLPSSLILTAVDHPEQAPRVLRQQIKEHLDAARPTPCVAGPPTTKHGTEFASRDQCIWQVADNTSNPVKEVLTLPLRAEREVSLIRLTLYPDPALPATGPGRATNGNLVVTEVEILVEGEPTQMRAVASFSQKGFPAQHACDDDLSPANGWGIGAQHREHELYLLLNTPLPAGARAQMVIHCTSKHSQHTLGKFSVEGFDDSKAMQAGSRLHAIQHLAQRNEAFAVSTNNYPCLLLLDTEGRVLGVRQPLTTDVRAEDLVKDVQSMLTTRDRRDALLATAETAEGEAQLEAYAQTWILMEHAGVASHYAHLQKKLVQLDPRCHSPWTWRVSPNFGQINAEVERLKKESGPQAAIDYLDRLLKDPRMSRLTTAQRQNIVLSKFNLYRTWPDHQDQRFEALREIVEIDPDTHLAIGAKGYIDENADGDPSIAFGWKPMHLVVGEQQLDIREGVANAFFKPAYYRVSLRTAQSSHPVSVSSVALYAGGRELARDTHDATLVRDGDEGNIFDLQLPPGVDPATLIFRININAPEGHNHTLHGISVTPYLPAEGEFGWR